MAESPLPEMLRLSLSDLALRIKILKVKIGNSIEDALSRALDPPLEINVQRAVQALVEVRDSYYPLHRWFTMGQLGESSYTKPRYHSHGSSLEQTSNRCALRQIPLSCDGLWMFRPSIDDLGDS